MSNVFLFIFAPKKFNYTYQAFFNATSQYGKAVSLQQKQIR